VTTDDLRTIYLGALTQCHPARLVEARLRDHELSNRTFDLVAIGKSAGSLAAAIAARVAIANTLVIIPEGYGEFAHSSNLRVIHTSHPQLTAASFDAGSELLTFLERSEHPTIVAISGGGSAAVERELAPFFDRHDLMHANATIIRAGFSIGEINIVRKHLSAIKGGRLARHIREGSITLLLSDVPSDRPELIASGPTSADPSTNHDAAEILERTGDKHCIALAGTLRVSAVPETPKELNHASILLGDNRTLVDAAASIARSSGIDTMNLGSDVDGDAFDVVKFLLDRAGKTDSLIVAGGETTVRHHGTGRGGRTFVMAAHVAKRCLVEGLRMRALFGSSDGSDGNSGAAGVIFDSERLLAAGATVEMIDRALSGSDSFSLVPLLGEAIMTGATGNNLRDLFLLARH
jgi:glycerate 2-kinase